MAQYKGCGRVNCRCAKGFKHRPFFYHVWYVQRIRYKSYVKKAEFDRINAGIEAFRAQRRGQFRKGKELLNLLSVIRREQRHTFNSMLNGGS